MSGASLADHVHIDMSVHGATGGCTQHTHVTRLPGQIGVNIPHDQAHRLRQTSPVWIVPSPVNQTQKLPTPINPDSLQMWLEGYDSEKARYLVRGFRFGFRVGYIGDTVFRATNNSQIAQHHPKEVQQFINKELDLG